MKDTPLLMCAEMVRATMEGRKTQTRRVLKPQPVRIRDLDSPRRQKRGDLFLAPDAFPTGEIVGGKISTNLVFACAESVGTTHCLGMVEFCRDHCPYGQPGDRLWVKETHFRWGKWVRNGKTKKGKPTWKFRPAAPNLKKVLYVAGEPAALPEKIKRTELAWHKRPSIFMPRWASRLTLEITAVRVERVQDIGKDGRNGKEVLAEGITPEQIAHWAQWLHPDDAPAHAFGELRDSLNAKRGFPWASNPFVWVIEFKRV